MVWCLPFVMTLLLVLASCVGGNSEFHVDAGSGVIKDRRGRERVFHGLNVVMKAAPWHPTLDAFDAQLSFADADIALLRSWGMNVVRLGVMWPGVEPQRGQVNRTYLEVMQRVVRRLHAAGIVTLLEFHQDLLSSRFCGEGMPSWVLDAGSFESFPEPLGGRWPAPSEEQCDRHPWAWYYFSFAVARAFQSLYENTWGWADMFARYWEVVATSFRDEPGVLGYELMNEPWAGDMYRNPLLLVPGVADHYNLAPFYEKVQLAIRAVDADRILFMESVTFEDVRCGFSRVPGGPEFQNRTVLSYHYYQPPNLAPRQAIRERVRESRKLGCAAMLTEFFVAGDGASVNAVLAEADAHQQSWIGWEYKAFQNKTGSVVEQSMFTSSGDVNLGLAKKLARTYPQAVTGSILSFSFDPVSSDFSLSFVAGDPAGGDSHSQVFIHRAFYYPSGLKYSVSHNCVKVEETERLLILRHSKACVGLRIRFGISKRPAVQSS